MIEEIISFLKYFGITRQSMPPLFIVVGGGFLLLWKICLKKVINNIDVLTNATAELQHYASEKLASEKSCKFIPLHPVKTKGILQATSPMQLSDLGRKLLECSGAKEIIDTQYQKLEKMINEQNFKTAYDVQNYISKLIAKLENEDFMIPIKSFVYNNPEFENNTLELLDIQGAMVIYLRDKYFEKYPELIKENKESNKS